MTNEALAIAITIIGAYLLGSIPFPYIIGRLKKGIDIRQVGSRNMGAMNTFYNVGIASGFLALFADVGKGAAAVALAERTSRPVIFLDDLPPNISSVRRGLPEAHIIHFVGDARLAALIGKSPDANHRIDDWPGAGKVIRRIIEEHG